jgi:hypothetical protein
VRVHYTAYLFPVLDDVKKAEIDGDVLFCKIRELAPHELYGPTPRFKRNTRAPMSDPGADTASRSYFGNAPSLQGFRFDMSIEAA